MGKKTIKELSLGEMQHICLDHTGCVGCPLKLEKNHCAYYSIKRSIKLSEEQMNKEIEVR